MTIEVIDAPPPAVLANLTARMRVDETGAVHFLDDDGAVILDTDAPDCPPAAGPAAARWLRSHHPDLWGAETAKAAPVPTTAASPTSAALDPTTVTELMQAVRSGSMNAADASAAISRLTGATTSAAHVPTKAAPQSVTDLMVRARQGDAAALQALNNLVR